MLLLLVIVFGISLMVSCVTNVLLYKIAERNMNKAEYLEEYIGLAKNHILEAYVYIKHLDERQIFAKDDEVGVVFTDMLEVLQKLNEVIQDEKGE